MALPLLGIMAAGAGVLGGGRYLLQKQQAKRAEAQREHSHSVLSQYFANGAGAALSEMDPHAAAGAASALEANPGQLHNIITGLEQRRTEIPGQQSQAQMQQQQALQALEIEQGNKLNADWEQASAIHHQVQTGYQQTLGTLKGNNASDFTAAVISLAKLLDPGSAVMKGEDDKWAGTGSVGQQFASALNRVKGNAPIAEVRKELLGTVQRVYRPYYRRLMSQRKGMQTRIDDFNSRYGTGISQNSVFSQGLDYAPPQRPSLVTEANQAAADEMSGDDWETEATY